MVDEWLLQVRKNAHKLGGAFHELFTHILSGSTQPEVKTSDAKHWVTCDNLVAYAKESGVVAETAQRAWRLLVTRLNTVLSEPLETEILADTSIPSAVSVRSLKRVRVELRVQLISGYGPRLHGLLAGWIDSLPSSEK